MHAPQFAHLSQPKPVRLSATTAVHVCQQHPRTPPAFHPSYALTQLKPYAVQRPSNATYDDGNDDNKSSTALATPCACQQSPSLDALHDEKSKK